MVVGCAVAAGALATGAVGSAAAGSRASGATRALPSVSALGLTAPVSGERRQGFAERRPGSAAAAPARTETASGTSTPPPGSEALYLDLKGIPGEATATGFTNQIKIFSFSWGASNLGKPSLSSISLQAEFDRATPPIQKAVELGSTIPTGVLTEVDASTGKILRKLTLTNVHVDSFSVGGASGGGAPSVSYSLSYEQIEQRYYRQLDTGGQQVYRSCYNVASQTAC
jgi:type VI protein secretion system component Hcp